MTTKTTMTTRSSLVLAAFAAAVAAQPACATAVAGDLPTPAVASSLPLTRPSPAALEQLRDRAEETRAIVAKRLASFVRIFFWQSIPRKKK